MLIVGCLLTITVTASGSYSTMPASTHRERHVADHDDRGDRGGQVAAPVVERGLFQPIDWNRLQVPWNRWMPSAMLATM
jgi:hypothetical protein